jgi:hypothetical protein
MRHVQMPRGADAAKMAVTSSSIVKHLDAAARPSRGSVPHQRLRPRDVRDRALLGTRSVARCARPVRTVLQRLRGCLRLSGAITPSSRVNFIPRTYS